MIKSKGAAQKCMNATGHSETQCVISDLNYVASTYYPSPAYMQGVLQLLPRPSDADLTAGDAKVAANNDRPRAYQVALDCPASGETRSCHHDQRSWASRRITVTTGPTTRPASSR